MTGPPGAAAPGAAVRVGLPDRLRTPGTLLGAGAFAVALVCAVTAVQVSVLASLDETVYKLAAVNFAEAFPSAVNGDGASRGLARLYSLILTPLFALLEGDQAIRAGRALNGVLWAATALPVFFLARRVIASPRAAAGAALLAIAVPWATLTLILFSEALSYLLFTLTVLAMVRALEAPTAGRDAVAIALMLVLVTARMQFAVLPFAWFAVVVFFELRRGARRDPRSALRRHPITFGLAALGVLALLALLVTSRLREQLDRFGGPYSGIQDRGTLPRDAGLALLSEVALLSLGVGLVAAVLAAAWYRDALRGRMGEHALRLAVLSAAVVGVLFASTIWAQGGWLDAKTEERYYIYAIPFVWIAAVAALRGVEMSAGRVLVGGLVLAAILFLVPVTVEATGEQVFLGPVSGVIADATPRVDGRLRDLLSVDAAMTRRDVAGWTAVLVAVGGALLWRRRRTAALGLSAAVQLLLVLYVFAAVHGHMGPIPGVVTGRDFDDLGWIDRALPDGEHVVIAENGGVSRDVDVLHSSFWNDAVRSRLAIGDPSYQPPFAAITLPRIGGDVREDGTLPARLPDPLVVAVRDSPSWQIEGRETRRSADGRLAMLDTGGTVTIPWQSAGLDDDRQISNGLTLTALGGRRYALVIEPPAAGETGGLRLALGDVERSIATGPDGREVVDVDLCRETGLVRGSIDLVSAAAQVSPGRYSAGRLTSVRVERC